MLLLEFFQDGFYLYFHSGEAEASIAKRIFGSQVEHLLVRFAHFVLERIKFKQSFMDRGLVLRVVLVEHAK